MRNSRIGKEKKYSSTQLKAHAEKSYYIILFIKTLNGTVEIRMLISIIISRQKVISYCSNSGENKFSKATKNRIGEMFGI